MPAATPIKMTAEQKEAQIMNEIRKNNAKFEPRFETTFFGNFFGIAFKTN
ncbi:hypothetical protein RJF_2784 [Candidozyma auris]|uniref:Uncharacterized protein n=1 Tax=Candidozyma auris TaxID=498019 RepID=A0A0L0NXW6_CANAR|nr:hypothetical protein QG37_04089 [[Candida] auris]